MRTDSVLYCNATLCITNARITPKNSSFSYVFIKNQKKIRKKSEKIRKGAVWSQSILNPKSKRSSKVTAMFLQKSIKNIVTIGLATLAVTGCGDGGDSGTTPPKPQPQPRALPEAGVYVPVLMDAQGQLINTPVNDSYRAVGFVYPASTEGTNWAMNIAERGSTTSTYAFPHGFSSLKKDEGYPLTLSLMVGKSQPNRSGSATEHSNVDALVKLASVSDVAGNSQSLWVLDYRPVKARIDSALTIQNWGGQIALQPMVTAQVNADSWYSLGESALFQDFKTERSNNGSGIKLTIQFKEGCSVSGETEANTQGLSKLTLTGWNNKSCSFNTLTGPADIKDGKVYEGLWEKRMRDFAVRNASVTAYLTMKPGSNGQKDTLMLGIPEITGITPFLLEAQPL